MKAAASSREALLQTSLALLEREGHAALSMRRLAQESGLALGTLYNYFPSKEALLQALVGQLWAEIFDLKACENASCDFVEGLCQSLFRARKVVARYPGFIQAHGQWLRAKEPAKALMAQAIEGVEAKMRATLQQDPAYPQMPFAPQASTGLHEDALIQFVLRQWITLASANLTEVETFFALLRTALYPHD